MLLTIFKSSTGIPYGTVAGLTVAGGVVVVVAVVVLVLIRRYLLPGCSPGTQELNTIINILLTIMK